MLKTLEEIYQEISKCKKCPKMDHFKVARDISSVSSEQNVFILSQSLAESQLRLSGVNFFQLNGQLGNTGRQLEKFLNLIGLSVFPPNDIRLRTGKVIQKRLPRYKSVYNTEIVQCYPGKAKNKGDRLPDEREILNCIEMNYLEREISLKKPKLVLLMGRLSTKTFHEYILKVKYNRSLTNLQDEIISNYEIPKVYFANCEFGYIPIQHASGVNPNFKKMIENQRLVEIINNYLHG